MRRGRGHVSSLGGGTDKGRGYRKAAMAEYHRYSTYFDVKCTDLATIMTCGAIL
jgi:hypothetical protein